MGRMIESRRCAWARENIVRLLERHFGWVCCAVATIGLSSCGIGIVFGDDDKECTTTRCTDLDKNCGEIVVDGCGVVQCGDCQGPETCGGGGEANVCGAEACQPKWECEQPLNGNEKDGCGNRRPSPACDAPTSCGNGVADPGEACDWNGNLGCSGLTPVCRADCGGCTPTAENCTRARCAELGKNCGEVVVDGCGLIPCGDCQGPETCGGGGAANVCGVTDCKPSWECEQPLNGTEKDGCGNRRPNPVCEEPASCGNGVKDPGEVCDSKGDLGCSAPTQVCRADCSGCVGETVIFDGSFSQGDHWVDRNHFASRQWGTGYNACLFSSDRLVVERAPEGRPGYAGKFTVMPGDHCNTEAEFAGIDHVIQINPGDERWYSVSVYLPSGFAHTTWLNFYEIKPKAGYFSIGISSNLDVKQFSVGWGVTRTGDQYSYPNQKNVGPLTAGWTDWLIHVKWANDNTGFADFYKNGDMILSNHNIRTLPTTNGGNTGPEFHLAAICYRGPESAPRTYHSYNVKIGITRSDVEY